MFFKSNLFKLCIGILLGAIIFFLPRPEGTQYKITGDAAQQLYAHVSDNFEFEPAKKGAYLLKSKQPGAPDANGIYLKEQIPSAGLEGLSVDYVDGLSPKAKRFLALLVFLIFMFVVEPIPLEITAILIGVGLVVMGVSGVEGAWAPYMHPVVLFIMCCLIFAIALDRSGLTRRLGYFIIRKAGTSVTRFTFIIAIGLGWASGFMHDAAACAVGLVTMLPMMRAAGIDPHTRTAKFMMLSLPFACSAGGMGTLVGGGRNMVAAAFLKEFTGLELTFFDWIVYALPMAIVTVPAAVFVVYLFYRPDPNIRLPELDEELGPLTRTEIVTLIIVGLTFLTWLTKGIHGIHYSITGMLGVAVLTVTGCLKWEDINDNLEWGTALFIFGGGISLGLAMGYSGAGEYFANLFFPIVKGTGWLGLFIGVGVFGAIVTNAMANVAAAALILPIVIPMAQMEGVDPTVLALCLGMACSFAMLLVIGCPPNAIAYSYRYFKSVDLTKVGIVVMPILLTILVVMAAVWWNILGLV